MSDPSATADLVRPTPCVGVVCLRGTEVLVIRRGRAPRLGQWSIPGGRVEPGETVRQAALRELAEETGVTARLTALLDVVDAIDHAPDAGSLVRHFVLIDFAAVWEAGEPQAGDDAAEAVFLPAAEALARVSWEETRRIIRAALELGA